MRMNYDKPIINVIEVKIEKGFATSEAFGIQNFGYDYNDGMGNQTDYDNSAW